MTDANERRRERLRAWIDTEFDGRVSALCRYYSLPDSAPSYLSQLLSGNRAFGERAARKPEAQCGRPAGWLDISPAPADKVEVLRFDRQRAAKLKTEDRELIEAFISIVLDRNDRASAKRMNEVKGNISAATQVKEAARRRVGKTYSESNAKSIKRHSAR